MGAVVPKISREQYEALRANAERTGVIGRPDAAEFNRSQRAAAERRSAERGPSTFVPRPHPSRLGSLARGFVEGVGDLAGGPGQFIVDRLAFTPGPVDVSGTGENMARQTGLEPADDRLGRTLEGAGRGVAYAVPTLPLAIQAAPAVGISRGGAAALELGSAALAGASESELAESGHPLLAMGAGMATASAGQAGGAMARRGAANVIDTVRIMTPEARAAARAAELSPGAMVRGSSEIKRRTPDVVAAINELRLRTQQGSAAGLPARLSSRQIMEGMPHGRGGRFFTDAEIQLTRSDPDYATSAARAFADNAEYLSRRWENLSDVEPDLGEFIMRYDEGADALKVAEREAWTAVREGDRPIFNVADLKRKAASIIGGTEFKASDIPGALKTLANRESPYMSLDRFQELRSVLLGVVRDARLKPESANKHAAAMASEVLDLMQEQMDDFARMDVTGKSAEWARARAITLENNDLYSAHSPVIRMLESGGSERSLFTTLRNARGRRGARTGPVEEAQRLVNIAEQTPGGMENLRALAAEDLFRNGFNPSGTKRPAELLKQSEEMYRVIFGDKYDEAVQLLEMSRLATRGSAGTAAEAYRVGSNVSPAAFLMGLAKSANNPVSAAVEGTIEALGKHTGRDLEWQKIVRTAVENPEFLTVLLEMPTERALPAWQVRWRQLLAKSSRREMARGGARAAMREKAE